jgi:hypothetical protein
LTGEWPRCSKYVEKRDCLAHQKSGKHTEIIARANELGFPADFDEQPEKITLRRSFEEIHEVIALFCVRKNVSVKEAGREALTDFVRDISLIAVRLARSSPTFDPRTLPAVSSTLLTRTVRTIDGEAFDRMITDISGRSHDVNLLMGSDTVLEFNAFHAVLANPNCLDVLLPLDTYKNLDYNSDGYQAVCCELIQQIRQYDIELINILCDNCPASINGVA